MKNIHIHKSTYYIAFNYEEKPVFAIIKNDDFPPVTLVNAYGFPFMLSRRELLHILQEDTSTDIQQFTSEDYFNNKIPMWKAIEE